MTNVIDRLTPERTAFAVEFSPPRSADEERGLWRAIRELEPLDPAYVSVTYPSEPRGRERTLRTTSRIARETTLLPVGHLTAAGHSVGELRHVLGSFAAEGLHNLLTVRGDPPGGPEAEWVSTPGGPRHADELVRLVRECGNFSTGVAATPHTHPDSPDVETETRHTLNKIRSGADYAVAQLFLQPEYFLRLRDRLAQRGCHVPILPGIMPITTPRVLDKFTRLAGVPIPPEVSDRLDPLREQPADFRAAGLEISTRLCERLIAEGVPALHFHSLNRSRATLEVVRDLGLVDGVFATA
ncbi:methylenetetrahydrofolate reductase [Bounagaea algeriensis]